MSEAAERYVKTCPHPKVKGSIRDLLDAIARLVPEGETTTPATAIEDLATGARQHDRTARHNRDVLERIEEIKVIDGGQGKKARYEMLHLTGVHPLTIVPLPLVGAAPPRRPKPLGRTPSGEMPDLFGATSGVSPEVPGDGWFNIGRFTRSWILYFGRFTRSWWKTSGVSPEVRAPLSSISTDLEGEDAHAREGPDFLDWFERTYPTFHHGARHTVKRSRDGPIVRELLDRGYSVADLQGMTTLLWSIDAGSVFDADRRWIVEKVTVRGIPVLRHKADYLDGEVTRAKRTAKAWPQILERVRSQVDRHTFHTWFLPLVQVTDSGNLIEVAKPGPQGGLFADWIQKHYSEILRAAVEEVRPGARVSVIDAFTLETEAAERDEREQQSG